MAGFDVSEFVPINVPSLYIPRVFQNIPDEYILNTIKAVGLGTISHIDSSAIQDNPKFKGVRIHFTAWNLSNENARRARDKLLRNEEIKVMYDDPWFWKIRPTRPVQEKQQQQHIDDGGYSSDNDNTIMRIKAGNHNRARLFPESPTLHTHMPTMRMPTMRTPTTAAPPMPTYNRFKDSRGRSYRGGEDSRRPYQQQQQPQSLSLVIPKQEEQEEQEEQQEQKRYTPHSPTEPPPHIIDPRITDNTIESDDQSTASSLTDRDEMPSKKTTLIKKRRIVIKTA